MSFMEWLRALLSGPPKPEPLRAELTAHQDNIARRLSRLTGKTRDAVLAEAYRKADRITEEYRVANGRRRAGRS